MTLSKNMVRAARSATRNIAEGFGKYYYREKIQFCRTAVASLFEIEDDLITAHECGYLTEDEYNHGRKLTLAAKRLTNGYIRYLKSCDEKTD